MILKWTQFLKFWTWLHVVNDLMLSIEKSKSGDLTIILLRKNQTSTKISSYTPRRFAKLGYCAGAIIHHLPELNQLLSKFTSNQHSHACKLYLSFPIIIDAMVALSKITEFVVLPFLDMVQNSNTYLLLILPQLYLDLKNNSLETLKNFWTPFKFKYTEENFSQTKLIQIMANAIADGLKLQQGRKLGIPDSSAPRATDLTKLPPEGKRRFCKRFDFRLYPKSTAWTHICR